MKEVDLERYKSAWKNDHSFYEEKLSRDQIEKFLRLSSKNISGLFKKSLIIDIALKILLSCSFVALMVLYSDQSRILFINASLLFVTILCVILQIKTCNKIPEVKNAEQNIKALLYSYIDFYRKKFVLSLIITSFSGALLFTSGTFFYFYYKYGTIRAFQYDDYLVFGAFIIISILLSLFSQLKNFNFHIGQLEKSLVYIEQEIMDESRLKEFKKLNIRNLIIYSIILLIGITLLILFIFHI